MGPGGRAREGPGGPREARESFGGREAFWAESSGAGPPPLLPAPAAVAGTAGFIHSRPGDSLRGPLQAMAEIPARDLAPPPLHYADWEN